MVQRTKICEARLPSLSLQDTQIRLSVAATPGWDEEPALLDTPPPDAEPDSSSQVVPFQRLT